MPVYNNKQDLGYTVGHLDCLYCSHTWLSVSTCKQPVMTYGTNVSGSPGANWSEKLKRPLCDDAPL